MMQETPMEVKVRPRQKLYCEDWRQCPSPKPIDFYSFYGDHMFRDWACTGHPVEEVEGE